MVNGEQYGALISPDDEPKLQLNLPPGQHECCLAVIPKDKDQEVYESNILVCIRNSYYPFIINLQFFSNRNLIFQLLLITYQKKNRQKNHPMF
jgi:hypothetical protein